MLYTENLKGLEKIKILKKSRCSNDVIVGTACTIANDNDKNVIATFECTLPEPLRISKEDIKRGKIIENSEDYNTPGLDYSFMNDDTERFAKQIKNTKFTDTLNVKDVISISKYSEGKGYFSPLASGLAIKGKRIFSTDGYRIVVKDHEEPFNEDYKISKEILKDIKKLKGKEKTLQLGYTKDLLCDHDLLVVKIGKFYIMEDMPDSKKGEFMPNDSIDRIIDTSNATDFDCNYKDLNDTVTDIYKSRSKKQGYCEDITVLNFEKDKLTVIRNPKIKTKENEFEKEYKIKNDEISKIGFNAKYLKEIFEDGTIENIYFNQSCNPIVVKKSDNVTEALLPVRLAD